MSFPGYLKSLNLINKRDHEAVHTPGYQEEGEIVAGDQNLSRPSTDDHKSPRTPSRSTRRAEDIVDEKGNGPSKSLWVGNIPPRTTSSGLRTLFARFGLIVSTKPMAKYAFVNFETLESAIAAFEACHDRDIFETGCSTINIRFTGSQAESKQVKDDVWERGKSMSTKAQVVQKQYFQPPDLKNDVLMSVPVLENKWPNGKPPTGPKSQRNDISPPPLRSRRSDCYRPAEPLRNNSYRSESDIRREDLEPQRGRTYRRLSDQHYSPEYSPRSSRSFHRSRSSRTSSSEVRKYDAVSPLPWERADGSARNNGCAMVGVGRHHFIGSDNVIRLDSIPDSQECSLQTGDTRTTPVVIDRTPKVLHIQDTPPRPSVLGHHKGATACDGIPSLLLGESSVSSEKLSTLLAPTPKLNRQTKSPSLRPLDRLRIERDDCSGSSVVSEIATNSSRASMKRKRCHDCKKPANDLSPLTPCSKCTRRYHSGCGDPKPSTCPDRSKFVCRRCQSDKGAGALVSTASATSRSLSKLDRKVHLASPPLSLGHDGDGSFEHCPYDKSHLQSNEHKLESFFPTRMDDTEPDYPTTSTKAVSKLEHSVTGSHPIATQQTQQHGPVSSDSRVRPRQTSNKEVGSRNKYKVVTCRWWASGNCTQTEEGCYYAHHHTSVMFPNRKKVDKSWTCFDWLHNRCSLLESACLHAHKDTGLHVWKDGRPSFKHVTCFWWSRGRCKWDEDFCKFGHVDTGLYSLDPSEIWQGGSKFSTIHPRESAATITQSRPLTSSSTTSTVRPSNEVALSKEDPANEPSTSREHVHTMTGTKPSLTINTSTNELFDEQHHVPTGPRFFRNTIGVPPQSPSGDSPDKIYGRTVDESQANQFAENSDLPTPELDENAGHEIESKGHVVLHKDVSSGFTWEYAAVKRSSHTDADVKAKARSSATRVDFNHPLPSPNTEQSRSAASISSNDAEHSAISRDPRLQRQTRVVEPSSVLDANATCLPDLNAGASKTASEMIKPHDDVKSSNNDDTARPSVKRCQKCQKHVFGTLLCRGCSSNCDTSADISPSKDHQSCSGVPPNDPNIQLVSSTARPSAEGFQMTHIEKPSAIASKTSPTPLKRSADGSHMFLKNKRQKGSSMFSSGSNLHPDTLRRASNDHRMRANVPRLQDRREPRPTLNDLIMEERAKNNNKKRSGTILDSQMVESPVEAEKEDITMRSNDSQPLAKSRHNVDLLRKDRPSQQRAVEDDNTPSNSLCINDSSLACSPQTPGSIRSPLIDTEIQIQPRFTVEKVRSPQRPFPEKQHHQRIRSPDSQLEYLERISDKHIDSSRSPSRVTGSPSSVSSNSSCKQGFAARVHGRPTLGAAVKSSNFSWASAITCRLCQLKHKKCLHNDVGKLCAVRCREYVLSRNGRPDTGRSRSEWTSILEASELDMDSDDGPLIDDTDSESLLMSTSSESENDFATAMDGDEMLLEEKEDHVTLLEKFQKAPNPTSPTLTQLKSPTTVTRYFVRDSDDDGDDEFVEPAVILKATKIRKSGVVFESESEDEDYLSDEAATPSPPELSIDPLRVPPKYSRNLFEIAPELNHEALVQQLQTRASLHPRLSRKQQWAELRDRQFQERRERFGDAHWEVDRKHTDISVTALVERIIASQHMEDAFGTVQTRDENIGFRDFLGMPKMPEICLMNDGDTLGFRDGQKERDRAFGRTGRGLGKRECDDEKWPVRMK